MYHFRGKGMNMGQELVKIGILGGTFDPIHMGHLILGEIIRDSFKLDKILFIPSGNPPHKNAHKITDAKDRLNMVELAVQSNQFFEVSDIEIKRSGFTYTIDTLTELSNIYDGKAVLHMVTGADVIMDILLWKEPLKLLSMCSFISVYRPGYDEKKLIDEAARLKNEYNANIKIFKAPLIDLSSTEIRNRVKEDKTIKYLVPKAVEDYIIENGLYKE
jgi:nicotinate-nucleotide adenylyltransferase